MPKSADAISKEQVERLYERVNHLTGLNLRLEQQEKAIILFNEKGPVGYWRSWPAAYQSLWSSVQIIDRAFLNNVLLADNTAIAKELAEARKMLAASAAELKTAQAERDLCLKAAAVFARCIDPGAD
ncbi:MAG: hypothetical protein WCD00_00030 [Desulfuromonadaceae bacterium]